MSGAAEQGVSEECYENAFGGVMVDDARICAIATTRHRPVRHTRTARYAADCLTAQSRSGNLKGR
jgi:hypothetical protein